MPNTVVAQTSCYSLEPGVQAARRGGGEGGPSCDLVGLGFVEGVKVAPEFRG